MATLTHIDACEHGVYSIAGGGIWSNVTTGAGSSWARDTVGQRSGAACHKGVFASGVAHGLRYPTMTGDAIVARFYVKFDTLPTGVATEIAYFSVASGTFGFLVYDPATGFIGIRHGSATDPQWDNVQIAAGQYYRIDVAISGVTTTTWNLDLQVDGRAVTRSVHSGAVASNTAAFGMGTFTTTTAIAKTLYYDDVAISTTIADFPIGAGHVVALDPGSDGTHSFTANDFSTGDAGTLRAPTYTAFWQSLVAQPWTTVRNTAVNICQRVIRTTGYVEIAPATTPETGDASGVMAKMAYSSSGTTANSMGTIVRNSAGTRAVLWGDLPVAQGGGGGALADYSESSNFFKSVVVPNPGTWTPTEVNAIRFRLGGSGDITPLPTVQSLVLAAEYADAAGPPEYFGDADITFAPSADAAGTLTAFSSASADLSPSTASAGDRATSAAADTVLAPVAAADSLRETFSSSNVDLGVTVAADGTVGTPANEFFGDADIAFAPTGSATGTLGAFSSADQPATFSTTSESARETFAAADTAVSFTPAADGSRATFSTADVAFAGTVSAAGVVTTGPQTYFGVADVAFAPVINADGTVIGVNEYFGTADVVFSAATVSAGTRETFSGSDVAAILTPAGAGVLTTFGNASQALTIVPTASGTVVLPTYGATVLVQDVTGPQVAVVDTSSNAVTAQDVSGTSVSVADQAP